MCRRPSGSCPFLKLYPVWTLHLTKAIPEESPRMPPHSHQYAAPARTSASGLARSLSNSGPTMEKGVDP